MKIEEVFDLFYIDLNRLEQQVSEHSFLFVYYCKELKEAKCILSQEKSKLDLIDAEESLRISRKPERYDLPNKPTGAMISNKVLTRSKHTEALKEFNIAQDLVSALQIDVNAFEHRKRLLSEAVKLHGQAYFANPYVASSDIKEVVEQLQKQKIRRKARKGKK